MCLVMQACPGSLHHSQQANIDAVDVLGAGEAVAYGVGSAVAVADVRRMKLATVLAGGHRGAAVTAVAWCILILHLELWSASCVCIW